MVASKTNAFNDLQRWQWREREGERERENHWTIEIPVIILHPLPHFNPLCQDLKWTTSPKVLGLLKTGYPPP